MLNIKEYLKKFQSLTSKENEVKKIVVDVIQHQHSTTLDLTHISYRNKKIFITAHPSLKNEIHLKKKENLNRINERSTHKVVDIH